MAINVKTTVFEPVLLVRNPAVTTAITSNADDTVDIFVNRVQRNAHGSVHIRNARSLVERSVTDRGATSHARYSCRAAIRVLVSVAKFARSCAKFVTRMSSVRVSLEQCSWN